MYYLDKNSCVNCGDIIPELFMRELTATEVRAWEKYGKLKPETDLASQAKYAEILTGANAMRGQIRAKYSLPEQDSFIQQEEGARAIIADPEALEPAWSVQLVRNLAQAEGVTAVEFAQRIMDNVAQAAAATEAILLQQRVFETALKKAVAGHNLEAVEAIEVVYRL